MKHGWITKILILFVLSITLIASVSLTSFAYWTSSNSDADPTDFNISDENNPNVTNPSAKYQVFSSYSVTNTTDSSVAYFAKMTEYNGLISEVTILAETQFTVGEGADAHTVTAAVTTIDSSTALFQNNKVVTILVIPASVTHIAANAFRNMTNLRSVRFLGNVNDITFGDNVFMGCEALNTVYDVRGVAYSSTCVSNIKTASTNAFVGSPLA